MAYLDIIKLYDPIYVVDNQVFTFDAKMFIINLQTSLYSDCSVEVKSDGKFENCSYYSSNSILISDFSYQGGVICQVRIMNNKTSQTGNWFYAGLTGVNGILKPISLSTIKDVMEETTNSFTALSTSSKLNLKSQFRPDKVAPHSFSEFYKYSQEQNKYFGHAKAHKIGQGLYDNDFSIENTESETYLVKTYLQNDLSNYSNNGKVRLYYNSSYNEQNISVGAVNELECSITNNNTSSSDIQAYIDYSLKIYYNSTWNSIESGTIGITLKGVNWSFTLLDRIRVNSTRSGVKIRFYNNDSVLKEFTGSVMWYDGGLYTSSSANIFVSANSYGDLWIYTNFNNTISNSGEWQISAKRTDLPQSLKVVKTYYSRFYDWLNKTFNV